MTKSTIPPFKLAEVSDTRKKFLLRWRLERKLDLELREAQAAQEPMNVAEKVVTRFGAASKPFDRAVCGGDIRLLRMSDTPDPNRFLYVAVLYVRDNFTSVVVPFSPYSVPACKDEWLTGLPGEPLKVLQFWNAQPVATKDLAQSWRTGHLEECQLEQARCLYKHAIDGSWPQGALRERIGLAILNPADERLIYQNEELALFASLRKRLFNTAKQAEELASRPVLFDRKNALSFKDSGCVCEAPERFAADGGEVYAEVIILSEGERSVTAMAKREADRPNLTVLWEIVTPPSLLPGLPACLYSQGRKNPLIAQGLTVHDGSVVSFKAKSAAAFSRMLANEGLWIVIQSS